MSGVAKNYAFPVYIFRVLTYFSMPYLPAVIMKNYFEVLQVPENSSRQDIQKSYRRLAKLYHPDVSKFSGAHEKFCEITEAYEFIMNHWPQQAGPFVGHPPSQQQYDDYLRTEAYEKFRHEAREKAHKQARMRYEKFMKQHEAFQESGINDIALLFTIMIRLISIVLFFLLFLLPPLLAFMSHWTLIFLAVLTWPFAVIIGWYIHDNRKNYLLPGRLYYTPQRIKKLFVEKHPTTQSCFYCSGKAADSKPFHVDLLKLKEIRYRTGGFRQHNINYINESVSISVPRSHKAFILHSVVVVIKILALLCCLCFIHITSIAWRFIIGMVTGGMLGSLLLICCRTRSNTAYLISFGFVIRVVIWFLSIVLVSYITLNPFDIYTNDAIYFVITCIVIFDSFLMQLLGFILGKYASLPLLKQYPEVSGKFREGYLVYNDVPVLSVVYPLFKWFFA